MIDISWGVLTPYYHCIGRCVRRAFLCGFDAQSQTPFELIDTIGRLVVTGKRGFIAGQQPRLLDTLNVEPRHWLDTVIRLQAHYVLAVGAPARLTQLAKRWGKTMVTGRPARTTPVSRATRITTPAKSTD